MPGEHEPGCEFVVPGEYEPHAAIWLSWPTFQWFSAPELDDRRTVAEILQVLSDWGVPAKLMCEDGRGIQAAELWLALNGYSLGPGVQMLPIPAVDIWVRDYGPIFLKDPATGRLAIASYRQNQWGYSTVNDPISVQMTELPERVAEFLGNDRVLRAEIVSEGGNRICNGDGVLLVNRTLEMQRNPGTPWRKIEAAHRSTLGVTRVIGLNGGLREDLQANREAPIPYFHAGEIIRLYGAQSTGGHADEFCQFAGPNRIVLAEVTEREAAADPIMAANYARLEEVYRTLSEADRRARQALRGGAYPCAGYRLHARRTRRADVLGIPGSDARSGPLRRVSGRQVRACRQVRELRQLPGDQWRGHCAPVRQRGEGRRGRTHSASGL